MASSSDEFDPSLVGPEWKKTGTDWGVVFNKNVPQRRLDIDLVHTLHHESVVCCVRFSVDRKYLATGCNHTAQIFDTKTGEKICVLVDDFATELPENYLRSVCFSPDGLLLVAAGVDKKIRIWNIARKQIRSILEGHQQEIYTIDFSRDGRFIVSGSGDQTVRIWDVETGHNSRTLVITAAAAVYATPVSVAISPDGRLIAAGCSDFTIHFWDVQTGQFIMQLEEHKDFLYSVAFTPDSKGLVSGSFDKTLKYWDLGPLLRNSEDECACTVDFTGHKDFVITVAVSHDNQWAVSGSKDKRVCFWDLQTGQPQLMLDGHANSVISLDLSPRMLATGSGDWTARLWKYTTLY